MIYLFFLLLLNTIIEFLPVSSTAHFLILSKIFKIENIDLILPFSQLAIVFYLIFYFRKDIFNIIKNIYKKEYIIFCSKILMTMIPTIVFGLFFYDFIKNLFYKDTSIALFLIVGSCLMFLAEKFYSKNKEKKVDNFYELSYKSCLKIGLLQMFSLIPGISRSATTICGGFFCNLSREQAILFSFLISIPISFCASVFDIYKNVDYLVTNLNTVSFVFIITLIFSFCFVGKTINFLKKTNLNIFANYRICLALLILVFNYVIF